MSTTVVHDPAALVLAAQRACAQAGATVAAELLRLAHGLLEDRPDAAPARAAVAPLAVRCLGSFGIHDGERRLGPWPSRRAKAVFKHLVVHRDRPVPKEVLMEAFWPDARENAARNNLHGAVHALRRFLRDAHADIPHVVFEDGCYALAPGLEVWVDVEEFDGLVRVAHRRAADGDRDGAASLLVAADELYAGPLFDDDPYEEWMQPRRRELAGAHLEILDRLRAHHRASGDLHACAAIARRVLTAEPWREDAHRELMALHAEQGRQAQALRQFQDCVVALRTTLGAAPGPETVALHERIRKAPAKRRASGST
jgi:DNA-binding SARP family transcriptional activator